MGESPVRGSICCSSWSRSLYSVIWSQWVNTLICWTITVQLNLDITHVLSLMRGVTGPGDGRGWCGNKPSFWPMITCIFNVPRSRWGSQDYSESCNCHIAVNTSTVSKYRSNKCNIIIYLTKNHGVTPRLFAFQTWSIFGSMSLYKGLIQSWILSQKPHFADEICQIHFLWMAIFECRLNLHCFWGSAWQ